MSGYTEACNPAESGSKNFTLARDGNGQAGIKSAVMWTKADLVVPTKAEAKSIDYWNAQIAAGNAVYVGEIRELISNSAEATFYDAPNGNFRKRDVAATRILRFNFIECACTAAQIQKMDGSNGRLWFETKDGFIVGKNSGAGAVGQKTSQFDVGLLTEAISGTPVAYLPIDITMATPRDDDANPFDASIDWLFQDLNEVNGTGIAFDTVASDGANLTFNMTLTKDCTSIPLTGAALANLLFTDANGVEFATVTVGEAVAGSGIYQVDITTALTEANVCIKDIQDIGGLLYASTQNTVSV